MKTPFEMNHAELTMVKKTVAQIITHNRHLFALKYARKAITNRNPAAIKFTALYSVPKISPSA